MHKFSMMDSVINLIYGSFPLSLIIAGPYLTVLCKIESFAIALKTQLQECGINIPVDSKWPRKPSLETLKFLFKQLQRALEDSNSNTFGKATLIQLRIVINMFF